VSKKKFNHIYTVAGVIVILLVVVVVAFFYTMRPAERMTEEQFDKRFGHEEVELSALDLVPYKGALAFLYDGSFTDDRWVVVDTYACPVVDDSEGDIIASRFPYEDELSFDEQLRLINDNWQELIDEFNDHSEVGMIYISPTLLLGFRLPDGTSDAKLSHFADDLFDYIVDHDPCAPGA
jgi:hypothetical protein